MKKLIAPILTGLLLAGGAFAAAKPVPGKGRIICPQVVGGKCSERQKKQKPRPCIEPTRPGFGSKCHPHGPF